MLYHFEDRATSTPVETWKTFNARIYIYIYIYVCMYVCMYIIVEVGIPILRSKLSTCSDTEMILELH